MVSFKIPTKLAESGDKKEELELNAGDRRFGALVLKVWGGGGTGHVGLESGRPEIHTGEFGFRLALHGPPDG